MKPIDSNTLDLLWRDEEAREIRIREIVMDRLAEQPPPKLDDSIVASYFFALRTLTLQKAASEISYHATSGIKHPPPGSLLEKCTSQLIGVDAFDRTGRIGLLHMAFPLKMMLQPDGHFDVVLTTMMLHHLGRKARQQCASEVRRVLKPGGRVLAVDFGQPAEGKRGLLDHFHHHGYLSLADLVTLLTEAGLGIVESGAVGIGDLQFVLAAAPGGV